MPWRLRVAEHAMRKKFDLVVIGTDSAASTAASKCRAAGWSVAVVDSRPFGETCALRGCDPKKVLIGAAALIDWIRRMESKGVRGDNARIEWPELMRFKRTFTDPGSKQRSLRRGRNRDFPRFSTIHWPNQCSSWRRCARRSSRSDCNRGQAAKVEYSRGRALDDE